MSLDFPADWRVVEAVLAAETIGSRIWRVRREDGGSAIVKAMKPVHDAHDELRGVHYLRWRDGHGAVRLLGFEGHNMLLEDAGELHLSERLASAGDEAATEIAADVLARLFAPSPMPIPPEFQPLRERFDGLFAKARADRDTGTNSLYGAGASMAEQLLNDPWEVRPLHGDLHHDNIIHGPRGWLAFDPKGVFGDATYDAANLFYNPLGRDALCSSPARIASMASILSRVLGFDKRRLLDMAFAYGCLSAAWHAEDGNSVEEERELSIARAIREVTLSL